MAIRYSKKPLCYQFAIGNKTPRRYLATKICYNTQQEAEDAARRYAVLYPGSPLQSPYQCTTCNMWHLTKGKNKGVKGLSAQRQDPNAQREETMALKKRIVLEKRIIRQLKKKTMEPKDYRKWLNRQRYKNKRQQEL